MIIRTVEIEDIPKIMDIHQKYFKDEFQLDDFLKNYICAMIVNDDKGIIAAGGARTIAEMIMVTNKDRTPTDRMKAIRQICEASEFISRRFGYNQLHAFVQGDKWSRRIQRSLGYTPAKGQVLVLNI